MRPLAFLTLAFALELPGQRVHVYSPFTRIDPLGEVVRADRGSVEPRHILSPGVPRNGTTPVRIVVDFDKPQTYWLEIAQNPENAVKVRLYKENFVETQDGWMPDTLAEVSNPYRGFAEDFRIPGQKVVTFWLEMTVAKDALVDRIKVEPQLYIDAVKDWVVYPMEVRIQEPVLPDRKPLKEGTPVSLTAPSDSVAHSLICGADEQEDGNSGQLTSRERLYRYVAQDLAFVDQRARLDELFQRATGSAGLKKWCEAPQTFPSGPEWYLKLRDAIYRAAGAGR
ncbi:MAG: hypothetical protein H7039_09750 [Bryobacteraceae bacterium]|nr:hypothetical protein [Bryobacteraceae bacterium]